MTDRPTGAQSADGLSSEDLSRRRFLQVLGGALSIAGLEGCGRSPADPLLSYVVQPDTVVPGLPVHYATSMVLDGFATGLLVRSREGRPIKVEGNPEHPASLGAAGVFEQASLRQLYDPHRARTARRGGAAVRAEDVFRAVSPDVLEPTIGPKGVGLAVLMPPTTSPTEIRLLDRLRERYPDAGIYFYAPLETTSGFRDSSGSVLLPQYDVASARVILSIGSDFLAEGPFHLRYAHDFAAHRVSDAGRNRLYAMESRLTVTGAAADHRFAVPPSDVMSILGKLRDRLRAGLAAIDSGVPEWLGPLADDLMAARGRAIVVAGDREPATVHELAHALSSELGNIGSTVWFTRSPRYLAGDVGHGIDALVSRIASGAVRTLVMIDVNPSYATPGGLAFAAALHRVPTKIVAGLYEDETGRAADWHVPLAHYLESWGDARAYDGTASLVQPLIDPLFDSVTSIELLAALVGESERSAYRLVRATWQTAHPADFDRFWADSLGRGVVPNTQAARAAAVPAAAAVATRPADTHPGSVTVLFVPDAGLHDGRFANNPWLQEFPRPVTTLTWGNAAEIGPRTAERLGVSTGDWIRLHDSTRQSSLVIPALVVPGHADDAVAVTLGYGRSGAEAVAEGIGVDVYPFWSSVSDYQVIGVGIERVARPPERLALGQPQWTDEGRRDEVDPSATNVANREMGRSRSLAVADGRGPQWAMAIDLARCIGCGACVVACQAENNVPSVGRDQVLRHRQMHWLRIDRYAGVGTSEPPIRVQPMLCQHCENAPCEYVCPVEATVHSPDGLNEMIYNRCVGTRFCSNNCPYKVRRFNWFNWNHGLSELESMVMNPEVTVRDRGVMEKCTFCVQRIRRAENEATVAGRPLRAGEVQTACQQTCPSRAIVFGSLTEGSSAVARLRQDPRAFAVLAELGTTPRVRYLAAARNLNPRVRPPA